jgi:hypothetical protein
VNIEHPTHNEWLVVVFAAFLVLQMLFAEVYRRLYKHNRDNFFFNRDMLAGQTAAIRNASERELALVRNKLAILEELNTALANGARPHVIGTGSSIQLRSGYEYLSLGLEDPRHGADGNMLEVKDASGDVVVRTYLGGQDPVMSTDDWKAAITELLENLQNRQHIHSERLGSLSTVSPDIWSFWDFLYFSTVLQTTVGLGDILPNSTMVRKIVVLQLVIVYALLIVFLNLVFGR